MDTLVSQESLRGLFDRLKGRWTGCDWPTAFGAARLNLQSMTSEHAALLSRATSGRESIQWREAARFLCQMEADVKAARRAAELARDHALAGQLRQALAHAERACQIERQYHAAPIWEALAKALRGMIHNSAESEPNPASGVAYFVPTATRNANREVAAFPVDQPR
jgi:hypothetical protein